MKEYIKILLFTMGIMNMILLFCPSSAIGGNNELLFRVKVSNLGLQAFSPFAKNKNPDDVVEVSLPGKLYNPYVEITEITKDAIDRSTPENAEASFYSANRKGDAEWILDNWAEEDQNEIKDLIKEFLPRNTKLFQNIDKSYITGRTEYKDYIILFIQNKYLDGRESSIIPTYIKTAKGWEATNALSADEIYNVAFAVLRSGEITVKEK